MKSYQTQNPNKLKTKIPVLNSIREMCSTRSGGMLHCSKTQTRITKYLPQKTSSRKTGSRTLMCFEFDVHTGFCARFFAPSLSSKTAMYVVPNPGTIKSTHSAKTALSNMAVPTQTDIMINSQNQTIVPRYEFKRVFHRAQNLLNLSPGTCRPSNPISHFLFSFTK